MIGKPRSKLVRKRKGKKFALKGKMIKEIEIGQEVENCGFVFNIEKCRYPNDDTMSRKCVISLGFSKKLHFWKFTYINGTVHTFFGF